jgi:hypothetical protein
MVARDASSSCDQSLSRRKCFSRSESTERMELSKGKL